MAIERRNKKILTDDNEHLLDIFSNDFYLELGTVEVDPINELLRRKLVDFRELSNFDLLKHGIGSMYESSDEMAYKLPFMHMQNIVDKNKSYQLIFTYGLLRQRNSYKETFAPIILIPVNLYFNEETILFQMVSKPFANPYIFNELLDKNKYPVPEKFDSIYDLDKFILNFDKHQPHSVRLENYLTICSLYKPNIVLPFEKFKLDNHIGSGLSEHYISENNSDICFITPLNRKQRQAVGIASCGNSFAISGYEGTGKTTTLINIATDAMKKGKRVLYVSDNSSTLDYVKKILSDNKLGDFVSDFTKSFNKINEDKNEFKKSQVVDKISKGELIPVYKDIKEYEDKITSKMMNFHLTEIMKELILTPKPETMFDRKIMEKSYSLYKYEINEVIKALKIIDEEMPKLKSFDNSHFRNIPITHQIKDPDEPMALINKIHINYCILKEIKDKLEEKDGFNLIPNYARLKNQINIYLHLNKTDIPSSWIEDYIEGVPITESFKNYLKAYSIYPHLFEEIAISRTIEGAITSRYNLEGNNYDVNKAINEILSNKFSIEETTKINEVLKGYKIIDIEIDKAMEYCDEIEDNFANLKSKLGLSITLADDKDINEILDFLYVLDYGYFSKAWCDYDNASGIYNKMQTIEETLDKFTDCKNIFDKFFESSSNLDNVVSFLINKKKDENSKYRGMLISKLLDNIEFLRQNIMKVSKMKKEYKDLTYSDYKYKEHVSEVFKEFILKHDAISNDAIRMQIERAFQDLRGSGIIDILQNCKLFKKAMLNVKVSYDYFDHFEIIDKASNLSEKVNAIRNLEGYIKTVVRNQNEMASVIKNKQETILFDSYLYLSTNLENLEEIRNEINNNEEYKFLFGRLFLGYDTNVKYIEGLLDKFKDYILIFKDPISLVNSFKDEKDKEILVRIDNADDIIDEIDGLFQQYIKMFKYGVNKYYYDDFKTVINKLKTLLENRNELEIYLKVSDQMKVLLKHKLYNLNNYIIYNCKDKVTDRFKYCYFKHLYDEFLEKNENFTDVVTYENLLEQTVEYENELFTTNIEVIKAKSSRRYKTGKAKHLNYNDYVLKNNISKLVYLTDTNIANLFLDINLFDLVLIDDAHMLDANEYYKVVNAKQVIIAGAEQLKGYITNNLITNMRSNAIIRFKYRFTQTPLNLLNKMTDVRGRFYSKKEDNDGILVSNEQNVSVILRLLKEDTSSTINFYTSSIIQARNIYKTIGGILYDKGFSSSDIEKFLKTRLNVSDLIHGYTIDGTYNIIDLYSYIDMDDESKSENMANVLLCCKKKLIIIDDKNILKRPKTKRFVSIIKELIKKDNIKLYIEKNSVVEKIGKSLSRYQIKAVGSYYPISLVVEYDNKYFGLMLIENPDNNDFEILNEFREFKSNEFPIITVWLTDLVSNYDKEIKSIVKEIKS